MAKGGKRVVARRRRVRLYLIVIALLIVVGVMVTMDIRSSHTETGHGLRKENFHSNYAPRVSYVVVQTRRSPGWCRMLLSSILTNVSVTTVGMGAVYIHAWRWTWIYNYMLRERMHEDDVIVIFDGGDTFFTETHLREDAMKYFLATTPSTPEKFNETEILQGAMTPPMLFTAEKGCYAPQMYIMTGVDPSKIPQRERCLNVYEEAFEASTRAGTQAILRKHESGRWHLNGGGVIARVWALREALDVFFALKRQSYKWWCDQSMWSLILAWSVSRPKHVQPVLLLRRGIMSLDYETRYFHYPHTTPIRTGVILHFPMPIVLWKNKMAKYVGETTWFRALRDSEGRQKTVADYLKTVYVDIRFVFGFKKWRKFSSVCSISDVVNPNWLSGVLRK
ncbi:expression site-associated gene 3 (ESAG3)-like protein, putative [Trypanosoma brucei gambiense DAL972]|uniref:Expression site-associated gene 3 (ESAG3)-like protein, putative n=1 Tax=Trypanosoma brucei gambiense (strain MHOM/CI/86/DAL972) TaxID=679716 RepID=D0A471_TRYB9|nr:expression site-associated gene 3 (ESAG3)-like protein, putative [Trypanosoma brucei gambiense DAL972]CBH16065.1 expression site-associated gene 3 (ESAG3)-like protein, putative [Trypanosoma brucei gambiense DAL972]|eukprot:XP_011778329.1 expression site-associated gene 3 (ESAG3)-like protein, putative [Trypanosoma brucei gambiense DAL972]